MEGGALEKTRKRGGRRRQLRAWASSGNGKYEEQAEGFRATDVERERERKKEGRTELCNRWGRLTCGLQSECVHVCCRLEHVFNDCLFLVF